MFEVAALDADTNLSFPASFGWLVQDDVTPPTLTMKKPAADALLRKRTVVVQWSGTDSGSGLARFEVMQKDGLSGSAVLVQSNLSSSLTLNGAPAGTYCFQVTAVDREDNSKSGAERCAAVPLDDSALVYTGPVTPVTPDGALDSTATRMTGAGSTSFTFTGRNVGVLFRKGPDLGKVRVSLDDGAGKIVDLYGANPKAVWWKKAFASSGPHTVVIAWTGQRNSGSSASDVALDGVAAIAESAPQPS